MSLLSQTKKTHSDYISVIDRTSNRVPKYWFFSDENFVIVLENANSIITMYTTVCSDSWYRA